MSTGVETELSLMYFITASSQCKVLTCVMDKFTVIWFAHVLEHIVKKSLLFV